MAANNVIDLIVNQKSSFRAVLNLKNKNGTYVDLSSYVVASDYKPELSSSDSTKKPITAEITDASTGEITLSLTFAETALMTQPKYVYDVVMTETATGFRTRIVEGSIKVSTGVTPITD